MVGKAVVIVIFYGYLGSRRLNKYVVDYIIIGDELNMDTVFIEDLNREDIKNVIK